MGIFSAPMFPFLDENFPTKNFPTIFRQPKIKGGNCSPCPLPLATVTRAWVSGRQHVTYQRNVPLTNNCSVVAVLVVL